jgi:phage anti-repressor protein
MLDTVMINARCVESRVMISSIELYDALSHNRRKYYHWINRLIIRNQSLDNPRDFFMHKDKVGGSKGRPREFFISITLAKAILIQEGTIISKQIRLYIEEHIEGNSRFRKLPETH